MLYINRYTVSYEPQEQGDVDWCPEPIVERESEDCVSFRDLVSMLRNYVDLSCSPGRGAVYEWVSISYPDYCTGMLFEDSLHFSLKNQARCAKYWRLALKAAGFIKDGA